jgi:BirA family biotin operon repressor/biotin-[acetyl-CoA-carboxylase] ligase
VADALDFETVAPLLRGRFGRPYRYADVCTSTQRLLGDAEPEGAVAVAEEQTEGRGRLGRTWHAPRGTSILASIALRPNISSERLPELSLVAGRAVADAIAAETGVQTTVKFPNDVLVGGKKVAGILAEASSGSVTLGVGVNVNQRAGDLPREPAASSTSLRIETGAAISRAHVLASILERLELEYDAWLSASAASG